MAYIQIDHHHAHGPKIQKLRGLLQWALVGLVLAIMQPLTWASESWDLGIIDAKPSRMTKRFSPLLKYLESKGVPTGKVVTVKTMEEMIELFNAEKVDFMFESAYGALQLMDNTGAVPIMIREKNGIREYNSVIFVPTASPVQTFEDLQGKVVAFEDPSSTSSFILPMNLLQSAGLTVQESEKPVPGVVAYYFSGDDKNTIIQVKKGKKVAAGGIKKSALERKKGFRLLSPESTYMPRHVVLVRKGLESGDLKTVLLNMKDDPTAQKTLKQTKTPSGFSEFDGDPVEVMNTDVRKALGL